MIGETFMHLRVNNSLMIILKWLILSEKHDIQASQPEFFKAPMLKL